MTLFDVKDGEPLRVSLVRLSAHIAKAAYDIGRVAVEGEVHRPSTGTGRQWFTLRDRASQVTVSVPGARRARCRVVAGQRVCVTGRLDWVPGSGQLQLSAEEVVPVGEGAIAEMIAEIRARLDAEGLVARPRRPIPMLPAVIGVVCGRDAAVRADIESVVAARFPGYPIVFAETTVSGPGAPEQIIGALRDLDARAEVEVIILARGGGDATQLLAFSDEELCRAVCAASTPVVAAIGHDGDRPLVDLVADLRCGTPSLAAGAVVPDRAALFAALDRLHDTHRAAASARVDAAGRRLDAIDRVGAAIAGVDRAAARLERSAGQLALVHPARELERATARLGRVGWREPGARRVAEAARALEAAGKQVEVLSPARVLDRGYAVVLRASDGVVVRDPQQVEAGTAIEVRVAAGTFPATVAR